MTTHVADAIPSTKAMHKQISVAMKAMHWYCALPTISEFMVENGWTRCFARISNVSWLVYLGYLILYLVLVEFEIYWMHRELHDIKPLYKYLHATHHFYNKQNTFSPFAGSTACDSTLPSPNAFQNPHIASICGGHLDSNIQDCIHAKLWPVMGAGYHSITPSTTVPTAITMATSPYGWTGCLELFATLWTMSPRRFDVRLDPVLLFRSRDTTLPPNVNMIPLAATISICVATIHKAASMLLLSLSLTWTALAPYSGTLAVLGTILACSSTARDICLQNKSKSSCFVVGHALDSEHFTLRVHHGGVFKEIRTRVYVRGTMTYFDFCDEDEISYVELVNMASEVGEYTTVDFYGMVFNGSMALIKGDADTVELCKTVGKNRVVDCYMITTLTEGLQTQESQACRSKGKTDKGKFVVADALNVGVGGDDDTDDYDPDSTSSEDDDSNVDINDSDFDNDDDAMFDCNVDNDVEFIDLGRSEVTYDDAPVVDNLVNIDGDEDVVSDDELRSNDSNSDGEGRTENGVKHTIFNENTDMVNPIFEVGMEFKTHVVFRDAIKKYAIKWGKEIKFLKSDRRQVRAKCKDGCPWDIYCAYVPNDLVYRVKTFKDVHSCVRSFNVKWVSTKWIVSHYSGRIKKNPLWPIPSLVATNESEKTVNVHPQTA
ncbi:hypothetical protein RHSIM_Rhsim09G0050000 [Rhododendron simsii]|uniref:Transposase MuDR plant domain-containing protein n=1 Tax=Rhododendron simsii TaxID=118357 RepID=A0A834LFN0_RHOSS|nr:hypothetical protein RHSIM_Rhsim09G0050000 [Rhododendron simsii]